MTSAEGGVRRALPDRCQAVTGLAFPAAEGYLSRANSHDR